MKKIVKDINNFRKDMNNFHYLVFAKRKLYTKASTSKEED
jgi:hypothetical protein